MKKIVFLLVVGVVVYALFENAPDIFSVGNVFHSESSTSDNALKKAFDNQQRNLQVGGSGEVIKILPDDTQGSRHQRFIIRLNSGQTLLIAHNIDLAPRVDDLHSGDHINFYGEYEWNAKGGVVHWTHHDPNGRHEDGWINHGGKIYQ